MTSIALSSLNGQTNLHILKVALIYYITTFYNDAIIV